MRYEQCSCPRCIELDFDNCICKDDCGEWLDVTNDALTEQRAQTAALVQRQEHVNTRQELNPLKHAYGEYTECYSKIKTLLDRVTTKNNYAKEIDRCCLCKPADKRHRGIPTKKNEIKYIVCEGPNGDGPTAACTLKYHVQCVNNGDQIYAAKNPTVNGNKRNLDQLQDQPWCCRFCKEFSKNDILPKKQQYLDKARNFIRVHPSLQFPVDCIVQDLVDELGLNNVNMDTTTS